MVELRGWLVIFACPGLASIETHRHSTVVGNNHATRILGVNPHAVVVAMRNFDFVERVAAIGRSIEIYVGDVDRIGVLWIGDDVHVIPGTLPIGTIAVDEIPGLAAIVRTIDAAFGCFNEGIHAIRVGGHSNSDAPIGRFR